LNTDAREKRKKKTFFKTCYTCYMEIVQESTTLLNICNYHHGVSLMFAAGRQLVFTGGENILN